MTRQEQGPTGPIRPALPPVPPDDSFPAFLQPHLAAFHAYVDRFCTGDPEQDTHFELKRGHTLRVLDNAARILDEHGAEVSRGEEAGAGNDAACLLGALYHDVGRFPQFQQYQTFLDRQSVNHGVLGSRVLGNEAMLNRESRSLRRIVRCAVIMHNRRFLPPGADPAALHATRVVRDADKLDILPVMIAHVHPDAPYDPVVVLHAKPDPERYTRTILEDILAGQLGDYNELTWVNDFTLLLCGWIFDLNFAASRRVLRERGLVESLLDCLPALPDMEPVRDKVREAAAR